VSIINRSKNPAARDKSQVILEETFALILLFFLLVAVTKVFLWFGDNLGGRQQQYERTRTVVDQGDVNAAAGQVRGVSPDDVKPLGYTRTRLHVVD